MGRRWSAGTAGAGGRSPFHPCSTPPSRRVRWRPGRVTACGSAATPPPAPAATAWRRAAATPGPAGATPPPPGGPPAAAPPGSAYGKPGGRLYGLDISAIAAAPGTTVVWAAGSFGRGGAALYPDCAQPTTQPIIEVDGLAPQQ